MEIDIQIAESLIEAFDHEETGILLYDKNDKLIFRNKDIQNRFIKLDVPYLIGETFYERLNKIKEKKLLPEKLIEERTKSYVNAKKTKKPQEYLIKGPTGRWIQIKDTLTPSGNVLTLLTNVTKIVEQEEERKRLSEAVDNFPSFVMFWDENDELIFANKEATKFHKNHGISLKLEKGLSYKEMLKSQLDVDLYVSNDSETGLAPKHNDKKIDEYINKRVKYRKKFKNWFKGNFS